MWLLDTRMLSNYMLCHNHCRVSNYHDIVISKFDSFEACTWWGKSGGPYSGWICRWVINIPLILVGQCWQLINILHNTGPHQQMLGCCAMLSLTIQPSPFHDRPTCIYSMYCLQQECPSVLLSKWYITSRLLCMTSPFHDVHNREVVLNNLNFVESASLD